jgi:acetyltransferase-like isoleucine patch superfamily enzyme
VRATGGLIQIGNHCLIGQGVSLIASNHQYKAGHIYWQLPWDETKTGVTVGNNVWVGCGVIILPGCVIGDNAIIGAGSVVTKCVPPATIWAGNPARQLRTIT